VANTRMPIEYAILKVESITPWTPFACSAYPSRSARN
jgi:hypothetical protein